MSLIEHSYKSIYLKEMTYQSQVLVYDWTVPKETDIVVEDIEGLDMGDIKFDWHKGDKFNTWHHFEDYDMDWAELRHK